MAKQRGIHQISGTVNNLTYYEQKYVRGGLIRRVNEGMSNRLKTDPAFANTRSKNAIFGMCSKIAAAVWKNVSTGMIHSNRPSVHARTTRFLYQYFSHQNFMLGDTPVFDAKFTRDFVNFLNSQIRIKITDFDPTIRTYEDNVAPTGMFPVTFTEDTMSLIIKKLNSSEVYIGGVRDASISVPLFDSTQKKYLSPVVLEEERHPMYLYREGSGDFDVDFPISRAMSGFKFWCVQFFPVLSKGKLKVPVLDRSVTSFIGYVNS